MRDDGAEAVVTENSGHTNPVVQIYCGRCDDIYTLSHLHFSSYPKIRQMVKAVANKKMAEQYLAGSSLSELSAQYGISVQRCISKIFYLVPVEEGLLIHRWRY